MPRKKKTEESAEKPLEAEKAAAEEAPKKKPKAPKKSPAKKEKKSPKPKKAKEEKAPLKEALPEKEEPIPELKRIQPEINIGMIGHVDHGKTTLVSKLTGKWTDTHSEEIKRGITIRLGYANTVFYKCPKCKGFEAYTSAAVCPKCKSRCTPLRRVSFVDAPGHETLMATMLSGSAIMDCAILLIAANEQCPQPQTKEHLMALEIGDVKNIIIVQNKIDLVSEEDAAKNYEQIKAFTKGTFAENAPVIPMVAQQGINVDMLIYAIEELFKTPERDVTKDPMMFVARSFDINKPGTKPEKITGGILGGALKEGVLKKGQKIEIRPGRKKEKEGRMQWIPITTEIVSIKTGENDINEATPGGSIALMTMLDPALVKSDALAGNIVGLPGKLPDTLYEVDLTPKLLERVVGSEKEMAVEPIKKGESLMLNVNSSVTTGVVSNISKESIHIMLKRPVCARKNNKITISRLLGHRFRLIGYGLIK
ncbi:MAG: translation initiation factor IF-2 subunit gamma [Nanoarchaeota archaeon]|nr:translation initiation factor IF-2 subunit gamma [Nanoarchaeota archaeon]